LAVDNDQYRELFIEEAKEHIDTLTKSMLILEKEPGNQEVLNMLFRSAHTLKGSSGMMGFKDFQELTHAMEDVFDEMRKGRQPSSDLISLLLECVDALTQRLDNIQNQVEGEIDSAQLKAKLQTLRNQCKEIENAAPKTAEATPTQVTQTEKEILNEALTGGEKRYQINIQFASDCGFRAIRAGMVLDKIGDVAKIVQSIPDSNSLDEENLKGGFKLVVTSKQDDQTLAASAKQVLEVEQVSVIACNESTATEPAPAPTPAAAPPPEPQANSTPTPQNKVVSQLVSDTQSMPTVRVKFDQIDKLMNLVGELVINKIALLQVTADNHGDSLKRVTENIDRLTADLQDLVMQIRMVPVSQVFDRFPRLVRDLSLKKGKKIDLILEGREIEVDRTVLDEIGEPLIHLLRNSVDHGIETPAERQKTGKPEEGKIILSAQRNGNHVFIDILDDGSGIAPEKIKASAIKRLRHPNRT
jgi:two-component system chemotaxis sensor kinase CheA